MMSFGDRRWRSWMLDETAAEPIVRRAVERGITFFDTGNHYSNGASERITGRLLRRFFTRRDEYVVATKVGAVLGPDPHQRGLSRRHILAAVDDSLRRLGTDYIDLYQIHRWFPAVAYAVCHGAANAKGPSAVNRRASSSGGNARRPLALLTKSFIRGSSDWSESRTGRSWMTRAKTSPRSNQFRPAVCSRVPSSSRDNSRQPRLGSGRRR